MPGFEYGLGTLVDCESAVYIGDFETKDLVTGTAGIEHMFYERQADRRYT